MPHLETSLDESAVYSKNKFSRNYDIKKGGKFPRELELLFAGDFIQKKKIR